MEPDLIARFQVPCGVSLIAGQVDRIGRIQGSRLFTAFGNDTGTLSFQRHLSPRVIELRLKVDQNVNITLRHLD